MTKLEPLIVSLKMDETTFARVDELRRRHFPPARNFLPAHLTLFHHLPGEQFEAITAQLLATAAASRPLTISLTKVRSLGRGVAIEVESPPLLQVRGALARVWRSRLTPQDAQGYRPHITVQNKVDTATARGLYDQLRTVWTPTIGQGIGLLLWRYLNGPWSPAGEFPFTGLSPCAEPV